MKQSEIKIGSYYLFGNTDIDHRKNMIGQIVMVIGAKQRPTRYVNWRHQNQKPPKLFMLSNGQKCTAGNLKRID